MMAPSPLTPISEETLPNYPEVKVDGGNHTGLKANRKNKEDQGCLFFYDRPEIKGDFLEDSFFKDARENYETAARDVRTRVGDHRDESWDLLRQESSRQNSDSQASGMTDLGNKFQIILDVTGYAASDIQVKAVGERELLVEGRREEKRSDGTAVNQSFSRRFCLSCPVRLDAVTSALSADGVLKVSAPKMVSIAAGPTSASQSHKPDFMKSTFMNNTDVQDDVSKVTSNESRTNIFNEKDNKYTNELENLLRNVDMENKIKSQMEFNDGFNTMMDCDSQRKCTSAEMVEEDQHFKITLDTKGYGPKDISVKAVGDRELLVEGKHAEKNEAGTETSQSFSRRFCLPELVQLEVVRSSLSPEGILTITAPKLLTNNVPKLQNQRETQTSYSSRTSNNMNNGTHFFDDVDKSAQFHRNDINDFFGKEFDLGMNYCRPSPFVDRANDDYFQSVKNIMNKDLNMSVEEPNFFGMQSPRSSLNNISRMGSSDIIESTNEYKMKLDVSKYKAGDITVKSIGDRELLVSGERVEKQLPGGPDVNQSFSRRFYLPGLVNMDKIVSSLAHDGTLTISAPKMTA